MTGLAVKARQTESGVEILFRGSKYVIEYPDDIWSDYPEKAREVLFDNIVYAETIHLPLIHKVGEISYNTSPPCFQTHFFQNMVMDLPSCADVDGTSTSELIKNFMNVTISFKDPETKFPSYVEETREDSSVVSISFGKDSLLTWAVSRELGLNPQTCFIVEPLLTYEEKHKMVLAEEFHKEFGVKLHKIIHSSGNLRDGMMLGLGKTEIGWGLQSTEYALTILPVAHRFGARYILMGNEQSCAEYYHDREGFVCYPAYDQSHIWSRQIDSMIRQMTGGGVRYMSVIEPLNDIAVVYALYKRYPEVAKYHMSCFVETETGRDHRWCLDCSVCSKMYLLIVASGFDPATVGLTRNMLTKECRDYYSLLGGSSVNTYALTGRGRDEQLFGFYLAWKNGDRSDLVLEFERRFLDEARGREDELYKTFFGIHESITMPRHINDEAVSIYKEVLSDLP
ncbi:hypothetical protein H8E65_08175 [Candidatus Bathyarchaeota archaeon]|nr:hypothetical protein [Candidatus Bathyarchaeota archaeon]MBL7080562.1 hypothetical protein [Candidatus Bathyarchaeota archaeon]